MFKTTSRRRFLQTAAASGGALGLGELGLLKQLPVVTAAEARLDTNLVRLDSGIESLVHLLEKSSRDELLPAVASKIRGGTSYREVLAALMLAAVRNVQPRPAVGFKFHAVLVINSAHLASLSAPDEDRWLPIFWSLDYFKAKQIEEEGASGWKLGPVDEAALPPAHKARAAFIEAMENWDEPAADAAVAALARTAGAGEVFELFYRFGARDYRSIGHKAIYVANSYRTLECIGWQHAEPILRSLAFALLNHEGEPNPAQRDLRPDRAWRRNVELVQKIRPEWQDGTVQPEATREMLAVLRSGSSEATVDQAIELLNRGVSPQSIWDAVLVGSGELLMRQPGIIGLHTLTTANALHYAYRASGDDQTRQLMLLQNCAFLPLFRESAQGRGRLSDVTIGDLKPAELKDATRTAAIEDIFADVSADKPRAAAKVQSYLQQGGDARDLIQAARRLVFLKGRDAHDYKFSSAVLEDYDYTSPAWRDTLLALSVFNLRGSGERDSELVRRTREALRA